MSLLAGLNDCVILCSEDQMKLGLCDPVLYALHGEKHTNSQSQHREAFFHLVLSLCCHIIFVGLVDDRVFSSPFETTELRKFSEGTLLLFTETSEYIYLYCCLIALL